MKPHQFDFSSIAEPQSNTGHTDAPVAPTPLDRTAGNYARETAYGVGRGLKNDVVGLYQTIAHPIDTVTGLYGQTKTALGAADQAYRGEQTYDPKTGTYSHNVPGISTVSAFLENAPIVGGMVQHAEKGGTTPGSPESLGAAAEGMTTFGAPELLGKGTKTAATSKLVTDTMPKGMITQLIRPMASDVKFGKNPAQAILGEKLVGNSLEQLGDRVFDRLHEVGREMDLKSQDPAISSKVVDVTDSLKPINRAMADATSSGNRALYQKLADLKAEVTQDWRQVKSADGNASIQPIGPKNLMMSPAEALQFKREIGDRIRWDGTDPFNNDLNAVKGEVYGNLKDEVNQAVPGLRDLNNRYSDLVGAGKAIERRIPVANRNHAWSLSDIALGASGHVPLAIARKGLNHPAVTTRIAQGLYGLGDHGEQIPVQLPVDTRPIQPAAVIPPKRLEASVPGNSPYGENYSGGGYPARQSVVTHRPRQTLALPQQAGAEGSGIPSAPEPTAPPLNRGTASQRTNPPLPANPSPIAARGVTVDKNGVATPTPAGLLPSPEMVQSVKSASSILAKAQAGSVLDFLSKPPVEVMKSIKSLSPVDAYRVRLALAQMVKEETTANPKKAVKIPSAMAKFLSGK